MLEGTRLMLHIPNATIHTLRELMEPGSEKVFAPHIEKLSGTAKQFFETEFFEVRDAVQDYGREANVGRAQMQQTVAE